MLPVTDSDVSNRIPSSCDLITKEKSCTALFQELGKGIDKIKITSGQNVMDKELKNGYKKYMKTNFCGKHWSKMNNLEKGLVITCKADTPGNVGQSCPDICKKLKTGK